MNEVAIHHHFDSPLVVRIEPTSPTGRALLTAVFGGFTVTSEGNAAMAYTLPDDKQVEVQIAYVDADGHPATVDGEVTWTSSDESLVTVQVDPTDSTKATIKGGEGDLGTGQITATADADLGEGVRELITTFDVTIVAGEAVAGVISPTGDPTPL